MLVCLGSGGVRSGSLRETGFVGMAAFGGIPAGAADVGSPRVDRVSIETDRLLLEPWGPEHAEMLVGLSSIAQVMRFIGSGELWSRERAEEVAEAAGRHWSDHGLAGAQLPRARAASASGSSG